MNKILDYMYRAILAISISNTTLFISRCTNKWYSCKLYAIFCQRGVAQQSLPIFCENDHTFCITNYATICISAFTCREGREFHFGRWIFSNYRETQTCAPIYSLENLTDLCCLFIGACGFSRLRWRLLSLTAWICRFQ